MQFNESARSSEASQKYFKLTSEDGFSSSLLDFDYFSGGDGGAGGGAIRLQAEMTVKLSGGVYVNGGDGQGDPGNSLR